MPVNDRALWATAFYAGLRRGELRALRVADVNGTCIHVEFGWDDQGGQQAPKSLAGRRDVPLTELTIPGPSRAIPARLLALVESKHPHDPHWYLASLGTALAWLSWAALIEGALAGFLLGGVYGVTLLARGRAGRKTLLPFGPFMIAGTFLVLAVTGLPG